jgi:large subunit ribosomal protein L23
MRDRFRVVIRPLVTEKTSTAFQDRQEYVFVCDIDANKFEIKHAIESMFPVQVRRVRTAVQRSRRKTLGRHVGRRPRWKKAYVTLREGDVIEGIFEG